MAVRDGLFDGLVLYLQIRDWAFEKMQAHPKGRLALDLEVHQYLYISNALASADFVGETLFGKDFRSPAYETDYERSLIAAFDAAPKSSSSATGREAYAYVRELRNSVVHRGLGSATAGHANDSFVFALCPTSVTDSTGKNTYQSPWKYMVELAIAANLAFNSVIYAELQKRHYFDPENFKIAPLSETLSAIDANDAMPDWAKAMAREAFAKLDYPKLSAKIRDTRLRELKTRLGVRN